MLYLYIINDVYIFLSNKIQFHKKRMEGNSLKVGSRDHPHPKELIQKGSPIKDNQK